MNDYAPLTGTVKEKYQTGKGKHGLIIDCDNPSFKYPIKGYDGTFGATLGLNVFQVGDKVEFKFEKTDYGTTITQCTIQGGHGSQEDTSFDHGANVENRVDEVRTVSGNKYKDYLLEISQAMLAIDEINNLKDLDQENKRAIAISAVINEMRNGR